MNKEGTEREANWYNDAYSAHLKKNGPYSLSPDKTVYYKMWLRVIEWIAANERIIDYGCGVGQFAMLCLKYGKKYVYGCDFSDVAIKHAKKSISEISHLFFVKDLRKKEEYTFAYYDVAVLLEVLEHIEFDKFVLENIPAGKRVIFSVPNYMCSSHVRCFKDGKEIHERYSDLITINRIGVQKVNKQGKCIWICDAVKK